MFDMIEKEITPSKGWLSLIKESVADGTIYPVDIDNYTPTKQPLVITKEVDKMLNG